VELRRGERELVTIGEVAVGVVRRDEAELVVDPSARGRGLGTSLLESILANAEPGLLIWAHGDHPAARALAASHGLRPVRSLLQLRAPVATASAASAPPDASAGAFRPGIDDSEWLRVNGRAFASHPEQGSVSQSDLDALMAEPWFDADDLLLIRDGETLVGYCWLKIEAGIGEFYVVGVDPDRQGEGLGRHLMAAGFARLAARGIRTAGLYVDADNVAAVGLYRSLGFSDHSIDIQYAAR
jgi:mycothiol synthase